MTAAKKKKVEHNFYNCPNTGVTEELRGVVKVMGDHTVKLQINTAKLGEQVNALTDNVTTFFENQKEVNENVKTEQKKLHDYIVTEQATRKTKRSIMRVVYLIGTLLCSAAGAAAAIWFSNK